MTKKEFSSKYKIRPSEKCCRNCKYGITHISGQIECCHPELDIAMMVDGDNICDGWKCFS